MSGNNASAYVGETKKHALNSTAVNIYLVLMFCAFPLFVTARYANIRHDKFYFFLAASAALTVTEAVFFVISVIKNKNRLEALRRRSPCFSVTDYAFEALIIVMIISSLLSAFVYDSFWGTMGRFCGLLTYVALFLIYLFISRNYQYGKYVFLLFAVGVSVAYALCILNSFGIDPLGMYTGYSKAVQKDFISTIGNKNIMSTLCCVTAPAFLILFLITRAKLRFFWLFTFVLGTFAMARCDSSSGLLGFVLTLAVISLLLTRRSTEPVIKKLFWILLILYSLIIAAFAVLFVYYTFFDTHTKLDGFMKFFRFNDKWGTHRGYMWRRSIDILRGGNLKNILFGCGPDTYYSAFEPYFKELNERFGDASNNAAHNEFLNYLITTGVLGLASYLALITAAVVRAIKAARKNSLALVFITPVICYIFQSTVNVATVITLPLLFIFIALSENISIKELNAS